MVQSLANAQQDSIALRYASKISMDSLKKNLSVLASDEYEGRETGRRGQKLAAAYIVNNFERNNVGAPSVDGHYQYYFLDEKTPGIAQLSVGCKKLQNKKDYYYFPKDINAEKIITHEIIFLGYGIDDKNYNDYTGADVKGKSVMMLSGEPINKDSTSIVTGNKNNIYWNDRLKFHKASEKGVSLVLIVRDSVAKDVLKNESRIESPSMKLISGEKPMPSVIYISKETANKILSGKTTTEQAIAEVLKTKKPAKNLIVKKKIKLTSKNQKQQISAENVFGFIEGEELKDEVIVISAHYDHLGIVKGEIYNGADDDGTGTATLLELSKIFAQAKAEGHGPKRSILFIAFSGEEKGLLGSSYYVKNPIIPLEKTVCDLNIDMVGRIDEFHQTNQQYVYLIGADKLSKDLHNISDSINTTYCNLSLDYKYNDEKDPNRFYYRSDHYNFAKNKIPVIFYFSGVHEDYHQPTDDIEKIRFDKVAIIARLVFLTAWDVANREQRLLLDDDKKTK
ncbi:possible aminopeptidase [sediment metagenome]|uniref:Possible aminopeptidase n=1 Tax=sediment metagenome TaxID=749907 RepID=D9PHT8_9ZZZZ